MGRRKIKFLSCLIIIFSFLGADSVFSFNANFPDLEEKLNNVVSLYPNKIGLAFKDLESDYYFGINDHDLFPAASIIKVPVMLEAFKQKEEGRLSLNDEMTLRESDKVSEAGILKYRPAGTRLSLKKLITLMITQSDNTAAKILINRLGGKKINKTLKKLKLNSTVLRDRTMLSKQVGSNNITSPADILKLLEIIYNGKIMSHQSHQEMLEILKSQRMRWGIPKAIPEGITVANKTGSLQGIYHDAGIIFSPQGSFILCVFTKNFSNDFKAVEVLREIVGRVYYHYVSS